jgi:hypothetical protein
MAPKGRDEEGLAFSMSWVRHHDKYEKKQVVDAKKTYEQPKNIGESESCCSGENH